jgi:ribonucleotide reductase alpha subunit
MAPTQRKPGTWSEAAVRVLRERYLLRDADGKVVETPDELCWRVATAVASAESQWQDKTGVTPQEMAEQFYDVMIEHKFLPNSPTLMNAGKGNNLQLSACYVVPVEDSLVGIFDGIKHAALIHQSGGGCIAGDAHVFTTFCGVEAIATLYQRVRATTGKAEELHGDHAVIDVRDLGIETMALNPERGTYERAQITHLWRYDVPLADQVRVRGASGLEVTTSRWHPFMVFDGTGLVERRADELHIGDVLPTPNSSVRRQWPHTEYKNVAGVRLDEEIAWLLGYYLGDGSLGWAKVPNSEPRREMLRWRLFDGRTASLEHARDILARRFDVHLTVHQDARGLYSLCTTDSTFISSFLGLLPLEPGPKLDLPFPEMVAKSPLSVVGAFLAGLVDSDGYVDSDRDRITFTTQVRQLASKVHTLCSLLGLAPALRTRQPQGTGRSVVCEVKLASEPRIADLRSLIGPYLNDPLKAERLATTRGSHEHSTATRLPIPFASIEDILQSIGIVTDTTPIHREALHIGETEIWLHRWKEGQEVNSEKLIQVVAALRPLVDTRFQSRLDVLENLAQGATIVTAIETPTESVPFYDFTVADHSTYLAGTNGLTAIHNTGFSFSRLRPAGSMVASTHGVASGPVSFMRIFDQATESVRQGGTRRGANMGILRVDHPDILQFIDCKRDGSVTNFNISVAITDEYMRALEADGEYDLVDPHTKKVVKRLRAKDVMDAIVSAAWATGDPGLVFLDRANHSTANPTPEIEMLEATNPCFTGDTQVWTDQGPVAFRELVGKEATVLSQTESGELVWRHMSNIHLTRRDAEVYQVEVESAINRAIAAFRATGDHKVWLADGSTTTVAELHPGDHLSSAYRLTDGQLINSRTQATPELSTVNHSVISVKKSGKENVYCGTVEETHRFFIVTEEHGGILVANCGEQYLGPFDACNLGSINLGIFVENGEIDWTELERVTRVTTRFLDDVIEINPFPLPEVHAKVHANRRIGLGVMGWAEMLFELGLPYDSDEAISLGERVMTQIKDWATDESHKMAEERGEFSNFSRSIYKDGPKLRNSTRTTVAPTGSISILADCSSGIEPIFALAFQHRVKQPDGSYRVLDFVNPFFKRALEESDIEDKAGVLEYVKQHGSLHGHPAGENPALKPYVTAHEIAPDWHIRMQASFQKGVDNSISKCLAGGTLIPTSQGLVAIEDFSDVEEPDTFVPIADKGITVGGHRVLSHYYAGEKPATRIRLDNGSELVGSTESHRVFTPDGWKRMAELHVGDLVVGRFEEAHGPGGASLPDGDLFRTNAKRVTLPERMTPPLAQFLGMLAADGHMTLTTGAVGLTSADEEVIGEFKLLSQQLFGLTPCHTIEKRNNNVQYLTLNSRVLCRWVRELIGEGAYSKRVPAQVLAGSEQEKLAFLRGISLDGYNHPQYGLYVYSGMSKQLAYGLAELCRSFGLPLVRVHSGLVASTGNIAYRVLVSNELQERVMCIERHKNCEAHYAIYQVLTDQKLVTQTKLPTSHPYYTALRSIKQRQPQNCDNVTAERLEWPSTTPVYRVTAVEDAGTLSLYDIEVEDAHEYVVNGIVSHNTINLPNSATYEDVRNAYMLAWNLGCLGITIFRDGSKGEQVLNVGVKEQAPAPPQQTGAAAPAATGAVAVAGTTSDLPSTAPAQQEEEETMVSPALAPVAPASQQPTLRSSKYPNGIKPRPVVMSGYTRQVRAPEGTVNITMNSDIEGLFEVFVNVGKAGSDVSALAEALGRLISRFLQIDSPLTQDQRVAEVARQLSGIGGSSSIGFGPNRVRSLPDAVARAMDLYLGERGNGGSSTAVAALDEDGGEEEDFGDSAELPADRIQGPGSTGSAAQGTASGGQVNGHGFNPATHALFTITGNLCPQCGNNTLYMEEGCKKCVSCGHSEC